MKPLKRARFEALVRRVSPNYQWQRLRRTVCRLFSCFLHRSRAHALQVSSESLGKLSGNVPPYIQGVFMVRYYGRVLAAPRFSHSLYYSVNVTYVIIFA